MNNLSELIGTTGKLAARAMAVALISLPAMPMALAGDDSELSLSFGVFITDRDSEFFALEYDAFDGSLIDLYAGIDYQLFDHVAAGLGLNSVRIDVGVEDADLSGNLDWRYNGGLLFVKVDF